ncbi:MAG: PilZ domain-containing protein [Planctomycetes bacterium]|nr:PilZ domain-containing protein [Planctomycetota bacterium]
MRITTELAPDKARHLLERLCAEQQPLFLAARLTDDAAVKTGEGLLASRFLAVDPPGAPEPEALLVAIPDDIPAWSLVESGPTVEAGFRHDNQTFVFKTAARGRGHFTDPAGRAHPVARLSWPASVNVVQKRAHVRVLLPSKPAVPALVIHGGPLPGDKKVARAALHDVSLGGFAFRLPREAAPEIVVNSPVEAQFSLPGDGERYVLRGVVTLVKSVKAGERLHAVRLAPQPGDMLERRSRARLGSFVAAEQRRALNRRSRKAEI